MARINDIATFIQIWAHREYTMKRTTLLLLSLLLAATLPAQTFKVIHTFGGDQDAAYPQDSGWALDGGTLYGTTPFGGALDDGTLYRIKVDGTGYLVLKSFDGIRDGAGPSGNLALRDGTLYGTTIEGGISDVGTAFRISTNGEGFAVIASFTDELDGIQPTSGLVADQSRLYGATIAGGSLGAGTLFAVNTNGSDYKVVSNFQPGEVTIASRLRLEGNVFYCTDAWGGTAGFGSIFKINTNGTGFAVLKTFSNSPDGAYPVGTLVLSGNTLYGMTAEGGMFGGGTVFKVSTDGSNYAVLKNFKNSEGAYPQTSLLLNGDTLFGTTYYGGGSTNVTPYSGNGTIFKMHTDGTGYKVLKAFSEMDTGTNSDGANPETDLALVGNTLFGTTWGGGTNGVGVLFSLALPPEIVVNDSGFGMRTNRFGFNIGGISNQTVVIEATGDLTSSDWTPLQTNIISSDPLYFSDTEWTNYPHRFYRIVAP
jgi:uncharacterized repeat protein (TIGR03803 family)